MKCKVNESPNIGMGRHRGNIISTVHSSSKNKINNNDANTVRRSSRRATIERRVWAVPKKGSKFASTALPSSAKKKENSQNKRDRKPSGSGKVEFRITSKSRNSQGIKRGVSSLDEAGHMRKKVKKKSGGDDVGLGASSKFEISDVIDKSCADVQSDSFFHEVDTNVVSDDNQSLESVCASTKGKSLDEEERTGSGSSERLKDSDNYSTSSAQTSQVDFVDNECDIGTEETMFVDDMCLHKAVIVEVVSDCNRSDLTNCDSGEVLSDSKPKENLNHTEQKNPLMLKENSGAGNGETELYDSISSSDSIVSEEIRLHSNLDSEKCLVKSENFISVSDMKPKYSHGIISTAANNSDDLCTSNLSGIKTLDAVSVSSLAPTEDTLSLHDTSDLHSPIVDECRESSSIVHCKKKSNQVKSIFDGRVGISVSCNDGKGEETSDNKNVNSVHLADSVDMETKNPKAVPSKVVKKVSDRSVVHNGFNTKTSLSRNNEKVDFLSPCHKKLHDIGKEYLKNPGKIERFCDSPLNTEDVIEMRGVEIDEKDIAKVDDSGSSSDSRLQYVQKSTTHESIVDNQSISDNDGTREAKYVSTATKPVVSALIREEDDNANCLESLRTGKSKCEEVTARNSGSIYSHNELLLENTCIPEIDASSRTLDKGRGKVCAENQSESLQPCISVEEEGSDHVSLSVALAQLLDSGCNEDFEDAETLTIHPASAITQVNDERKGVVTVECDLEDEAKRDHIDDDAEEDEGKLFIKEEDEEEEEEENDKVSEVEIDQDESDAKAPEDQDIELDEQITIKFGDPVTKKVEIINSTVPETLKKTTHESEAEMQSLNLQKPKKQLPALIKISSRPPTIKTPLKCPECPMQFCTVRSLFWHFGLHGARSQETSLPPILLQDLIVPWDRPSTSLFISQAHDLLEKSEKSMQDPEGEKLLDTDRLPGEIDPDAPESVPSLIHTPTSDSVPALSPSPLPTPTLSSVMSLVSSSSSSLSLEAGTNFDKGLIKDQPPPLQLIRNEESSGSNGDVILKIPIPRLKRKLQSMQSSKADKFVNILPKISGQKHLMNCTALSNPQANLMQESNSPPPQVTFHPASAPLDLVTVTPQSPLMPKMMVPTNSSSQVHIQPIGTPKNLIATSQSVMTPQPLVSIGSSTPLMSVSQTMRSSNVSTLSSPLSLSIPQMTSNTKTTASNASHITLIPMDSVPAVAKSNSQGSKVNSTSVQMLAPGPLPTPKAPTPMDGVEKDGLVMINSNLALRIVSSLPTTLDTTTNTTNTTTIQPITNPSVNNLTILPQVDGSRGFSSLRENKNPDILTIVPQVDLSKRMSSTSKATTFTSNSSASSSIQTSTTAGSQVVKLYLLHSKDSSNQNVPKVNATPDSLKNLNGVKLKHLNFLIGKVKDGSDRDTEADASDDDDEDEDEEEGEMVIADVKEEVEEDLMDPLSLCAVTMEDEHLESSNQASSLSQSNVPISTVEDEKGNKSQDRVEVKVRGKKEKLDIVKYEARKYVCCYCNRRFGWSTDLKRHVILHTGERPFQCKVCPTAFTRKFLLQNHMKRMHPDRCKMSDLWP